MKPEAYIDTQNKLLCIARLTIELDLDSFLAAIERADTVGSVLAPSLWQMGHRPLERIRRLAEAAKALKEAAAEALGVEGRVAA